LQSDDHRKFTCVVADVAVHPEVRAAARRVLVDRGRIGEIGSYCARLASDTAMATSGDRSIANIGWLYMHDAAEVKP
jgi:hypothetical protein